VSPFTAFQDITAKGHATAPAFCQSIEAAPGGIVTSLVDASGMSVAGLVCGRRDPFDQPVVPSNPNSVAVSCHAL
jgi:hypothetical protein